jgi:phage tail-like protein
LLAAAVAAVGWAAIAATGDEPVTAARFSIVIDGTQIASFGELGGISSGIDATEMELSATGLRLPAKRKPPTVVLTRGLTRGLELSAWHEAALDGGLATRKNADIVMYATDGTEIARYHLENAWPAKLEIGALKAGASEVLMETVTIVCERIHRVS